MICCAVGELLKNFNFSSDPFELELKSLAVMEQGHVEDAVGNTAGYTMASFQILCREISMTFPLGKMVAFSILRGNIIFFILFYQFPNWIA